MFKKLIYYTFIFIILLSFTSCKKESFHKIRFEVEFIQDCENCYADVFAVNCTPHYSDQEPAISASMVTTGFVWHYEYWMLEDGDEVKFAVSPTGDEYQYRMNVYIDDVLVSYRECYGPYGTIVIDEWGLNNSSLESGVIEFTYYE